MTKQERQKNLSICAELGKHSASNEVAIVCGDTCLTYSELFHQVIKYAAAFEKAGIGKNAKVMLLTGDPVSFVINFLVLLHIGAVPMPFYAHTGKSRIQETIEKYDINFVVSDNGETSVFEEAEGLSIGDSRIYPISDQIDQSLEDTVLILFSSGTTGLPKAIMLTEKNIISNIQGISAYLKIRTNESMLLIKNLNHSSTIIGEICVGLYNGCRIVFTRKLVTTKNICNLLEEEKINIFFAVPTILKDILVYREKHDVDFNELRCVNFYSAPISLEDLNRLLKVFEGVNFIYSYGQTEASPRVTYIERNDLVRKLKSSGKCIKDVSLRIADENGKSVCNGVNGEIVVSGPNVMKGYYRNEELTAKKIRNHELYTGDMGYLDEDGFLYVNGRNDNMIISAGKNIYPEEIEEVFASFPGVECAYVDAVAASNQTQKLRAYIVLHDKQNIDKHALSQHVKNHLENYKIPAEVFVVDQIGRTLNGKISRRQTFEEKEKLM